MTKQLLRPYTPDKPVAAIVGEAAGAQEEVVGKPFVGASGKELVRMLKQAGIDPESVYYTNVFMSQRPPDNDINKFFGKKLEAQQEHKRLGYEGSYRLTPLSSGKYLMPRHYHELDRLYSELSNLDVNLVIPVGNISTWALLGSGKISKVRGTVAWSDEIDKKVLPTYHPALVLRMWNYRPIVVADFLKAKQEMKGPNLQLPAREVWINPTIEDILFFENHYIRHSNLVGVDIENTPDFMTHIGFAPGEDRAIVIPFTTGGKGSFQQYWTYKEDMEWAFKIIKRVMEDPNIHKTGQNFLHDMQVLWHRHGIRTYGYTHDTMIQAHVIQPELPKDLGSLGTFHTNERAWKFLSNVQSGKRED